MPESHDALIVIDVQNDLEGSLQAMKDRFAEAGVAVVPSAHIVS